MATKLPASTWENGFRQRSSEDAPWVWPREHGERGGDEGDLWDSNAYVTAPSVDLVSSTTHNTLGINVIRNWPTLYDGTNSPHGLPSWWAPKQEVDVLICGAGPSGLEVAVSLARQGLSFRIIDKADGPLTAGRADGVQPRFLETVAQWGLAKEIHDEGPMIERTAIYKDGKRLVFRPSHQSDSRYRGLHVITQGQIERVYIRDLSRHQALVERSSTISDFQVDEATSECSHPVRVTVSNSRTGCEETVRAKFLVGSDGAASSIRRSLGIPFDGVSTNIYWGVMDGIFESDYPHAWVFGPVISSKHGVCVVIPRENGYMRLYTQLDVSHTGPISASRQASDPIFAESGGRVDVHSVTPDEVLEQANRIFSPYKLKFGAPLSWFAIWKISERVARSYSSPDLRVHLVGDAAHVHSVMGAFGLNASILDAANLAWKLGLVTKNEAKMDVLLPTYGTERRKHAVRIIEVSGEYLRWLGGSTVPLANLRDLEALQARDVEATSGGSSIHSDHSTNNSTENGIARPEADKNANNLSINGSKVEEPTDSRAEDLKFLTEFFKANGKFLLGVDCPYDESILAPSQHEAPGRQRAVRVKNGVRAPNPRVCFAADETGYLYDKLAGPPRFHLVLFCSSMSGREVRRQVKAFLGGLRSPDGYYNRFGGVSRFNLVLVVKLLPFEWENMSDAEIMSIKDSLTSMEATILYDDRAPDEDAHTTWGVNQLTGGVAVIRPDLWVSLTAFPDETDRIEGFFEGFML